MEVRVANATSYLAQKVLVLDRRQEDRAKDVLYIHDTLLTFGSSLRDLERIWTRSVYPGIHERARRKLRAAGSKLFTEVSNATRGASRIAIEAGRSVRAEEISQVCRFGLAEVFT